MSGWVLATIVVFKERAGKKTRGSDPGWTHVVKFRQVCCHSDPNLPINKTYLHEDSYDLHVAPVKPPLETSIRRRYSQEQLVA